MKAFSYKIKTPAKVNARLKVIGRRSDGYHELVSIMVPVGLFDILELKEFPDGGIDIHCEGYEVPADETNLVYIAAKAFMEKTGIRDGISISVEKKIPVAAGLGGGSSDAAAILLALNNIYSKLLSGTELHDIAVKIGADVPFFLNPEPSLATGVGDILEPLTSWPDLWYLIVKPKISVSTAWVYQNLKLELTSGEYDYIVTTLKDDTFAISRILENDLEKVTSAHFPIINTLKKVLKDAGAEGAIMSGSGPSVFGLFSSSQKAGFAKELLVSRNLGDVFLVKGGSIKHLTINI